MSRAPQAPRPSARPSTAAGRRKKRLDPVMRFVRGSAITAWLMMTTVLMMLGRAEPEQETGWERAHGLAVRKTWDAEWLGYATAMAALTFLVCVVGLVANSRRLKRTGDQLDRSLLVVGAATAAGTALYLFLA